MQKLDERVMIEVYMDVGTSDVRIASSDSIDVGHVDRKTGQRIHVQEMSQDGCVEDRVVDRCTCKQGLCRCDERECDRYGECRSEHGELINLK